MSGFFSSGRVDTTRFDRAKLPCGPNNTEAVYRVRLLDACDHIGGNGGDRTQFDAQVVGGPLDGKKASELVMHGGYQKAWMADKARGTVAITLGAFLGFSADKSGFKVTNEVFAENTRSQQYNGNTVAAKTRDASDLPLVQKDADAFLIVKPYFDRKTGDRKRNQKTNQLSVTYEFLPLSANRTISTVVESADAAQNDDDLPLPPSDEEPAVDALALAMAAGWKVNPKAPQYYYKSGEKDQHKEAALRALFTK